MVRLKSGFNLTFVGSVLVFGRAQRPLLPEPKVRTPEPSLSTARASLEPAIQILLVRIAFPFQKSCQILGSVKL
jgi:hypothetical protein